MEEIKKQTTKKSNKYLTMVSACEAFRIERKKQYPTCDDGRN